MRQLKKEVWPYVVEVKIPRQLSPYTYIPDRSKVKEIDRWCTDNVGIRFRSWYGYDSDSAGKRIYAFKDKETALVFKIKWGYGNV